MKKFLFVAIIAAGTMVACNDTSNTVNGVDTTTQSYKDSVANAAGTGTGGSMMGTGSDTTGTGSGTMSSDSGSTMMSDSSHK